MELWAYRRAQQVAMEALLREQPATSASSLASEDEETMAKFELKRLARYCRHARLCSAMHMPPPPCDANMALCCGGRGARWRLFE